MPTLPTDVPIPSLSGVAIGTLNSTPIPTDLIAVASICIPITILAICARIFIKAVDLKRLHVEDYIILVAGAGFISFIGVLFVASQSGMGTHIWELSGDTLKHARLYTNVLNIIYPPVMSATKIALFMHFIRIFCGIQRNFLYWASMVLIAISAMSCTGIFFTEIVACTPRAKISDSSIPGSCISRHATLIASSSVDLFLNLTVLVLSGYALSRLRFPVPRKLAVSGVYAIGLFACTASAVRLYYSSQLNKDPDSTVAIWPVYLWSLVEMTCFIFVACCPIFPRLAAHLSGKTKQENVDLPKHPSWIAEPLSRLPTPTEVSKKQIYRLSKYSGITKNESVYESAPQSPSELVFPEKPLKTVDREDLLFADYPLKAHSDTSSTALPDTPLTAPSNPPSIALMDRAPTPLDLSAESSESLNRPISRISYESQANATIAEIMEEDDVISPLSSRANTLGSLLSMPLSRATTFASTGSPSPPPQLQQATSMAVIPINAAERRITPIGFPTIRKTVDVRVSNHTNPGSPIRFNKPDPSW